MGDVFIVGAARTPLGRRKGGLAGVHPVDLLGVAQTAAVERAGANPEAIDQIIGGCVSQVGEQSFNIARTAWLAQGYPMEVPATTIDGQCGSSQQATSMAAGLIGAGIEDVVLACGVEMMTRVPLGSNMKGGSPLSPGYAQHYAYASQFQGAEMIAKEYGITREDTDRFGLRSQQLARVAWDEGRYEREVIPVQAPVLDGEGKPSGDTVTVSRDEGLRDSSLEKLAKLNAVMDAGVHTAGTSSQITDGAAAVLLASEAWAKQKNLPIIAYITNVNVAAVNFINSDGLLMAPVFAISEMLKMANLRLQEFDFYEIHEAFAAQTIATLKAWQSEEFCRARLGRNEPMGPIELAKMNVKGGSVAIGHPFAATGARVIATMAKLLSEKGSGRGLVSVCTAGGMGVTAILEAAND